MQTDQANLTSGETNTKLPLSNVLITRDEVLSLLSSLRGDLMASFGATLNAALGETKTAAPKIEGEISSFLHERLAALENWAASLPLPNHSKFTAPQPPAPSATETPQQDTAE